MLPHGYQGCGASYHTMSRLQLKPVWSHGYWTWASEQLRMSRLEVEYMLVHLVPLTPMAMKFSSSCRPQFHISLLHLCCVPPSACFSFAGLPLVFAPLCLAGVWVCSAFNVVGSACSWGARVVREVPPGRFPPSQPGLTLSVIRYGVLNLEQYIRIRAQSPPSSAAGIRQIRNVYWPFHLGNIIYLIQTLVFVCLIIS